MVSQSLLASEYEILVIENGPQSGTEDITQRIASDYSGIALRYLHDRTPGLLAGRHRGAQEARGEILVFADDDVDASPDWLTAAVETFSDPAVHLVGGRNLPRFELPPPAWIDSYWYTPPYGGRGCTYLSLLDLGDEPLPIDANYVWGLNFAIRRETLFDLGGFHPDNLPDHLQHFQGDGETGLTMKANEAGLRAVYQPRAIVHHRIPAARLTIEYFMRRAFYQGVCDSFTAIRREPGCLAFAAGSETQQSVLLAGVAIETPTSEVTFGEVDRRVQASYRAGYAFHQNAVRRHPKLLEWVLRRDYWDYTLPDLGPSVLVPAPGS